MTPKTAKSRNDAYKGIQILSAAGTIAAIDVTIYKGFRSLGS